MELKVSNPYIKKVKKLSAASNSLTCSMAGTSSKVFFFLLLTAVGICISASGIIPIENSITAVLICLIVSLISSLISLFIPSTTPVLGSIFCLTEGYVVGWLCMSYSYLYNGVVPTALILTFIVIFAMAFLYSTGIIKVNQKFRAIVSTFFFASLIFGVFIFISSFFTPVFLNFFYGYGPVAIALSVVDVILAALFIVTDFDSIVTCISKGYPKKTEWLLAFSLVMSIIILFIRILNLLVQIAGASNND